MAEMGIGVSPKVVIRDDMGRFIRAVEDAAAPTCEDMAKEGVRLSRMFAPVGKKADRRTLSLRDSIRVGTLTRNSAQWIATARHALPIEYGARPHEITGWVKFYWEKMGRNWYPGHNMIQHPGNTPRPYLRPAYQMVMSRWMEFARRHYPQ